MTDPLTSTWEGYEFLASGDGRRLERWAGVVVSRPETSALWPMKNEETQPVWQGFYSGTRATGGEWKWKIPLPDPCIVRYGSLCFQVRPTNSKHLGIFPEQTKNWDWIQEIVKAAKPFREPPRVLNLFGYTGGATLAAAAAGCTVTHLDAARAMVSWCSENARLSELGDAPIRYIVDDSLSFLQREIRRGNRYDAIIMDPPSFGRSKGGGLWKLPDHLPFLIDTAQEALSETPLFLLLNTYSEALDDLAEAMITKRFDRLGGSLKLVELGLTGTLDQQWLPCGQAYRWTA